MSSVILPVRAFTYSTATIRYLYHQSSYVVGGGFLPDGVLLGTLFVTIKPATGTRPMTLVDRKVWASRAGFFGVLLPTSNVMQNLFGIAGTQNVDVLIRLSARSQFAQSGISITEVTNLGIAPTT